MKTKTTFTNLILLTFFYNISYGSASDVSIYDSHYENSHKNLSFQDDLPIECHEKICSFLDFNEKIKKYGLLNKYFRVHLVEAIPVPKLNITDERENFRNLFFSRLENLENKPIFKVRDLTISLENLDDRQEVILVKWLEMNTTLTSLNILISNNDFWIRRSGPDEYKNSFIYKLAQILKTNIHLKKLDLSNNLLNYHGAWIIEAMEYNRGIHTLIMNHTMDEKGMYSERIEEVLIANNTLQNLSLINPKLENNGYQFSILDLPINKRKIITFK